MCDGTDYFDVCSKCSMDLFKSMPTSIAENGAVAYEWRFTCNAMHVTKSICLRPLARLPGRGNNVG